MAQGHEGWVALLLSPPFAPALVLCVCALAAAYTYKARRRTAVHVQSHPLALRDIPRAAVFLESLWKESEKGAAAGKNAVPHALRANAMPSGKTDTSGTLLTLAL